MSAKTATRCKKSETQKLVEYFRNDGWAGDEDGLSPAETAIRAMREYDALLSKGRRT